MEDKEILGQKGEKTDQHEGRPTESARLISENIDSVDEVKYFDKKEVLFGHVISLILGDDNGIIGSGSFYLKPDSGMKMPQEERTERAQEEGKGFIKRLKWEERQDAIPEEIRGMIRITIGEIEEIKWDSFENLQKTREIWEREVFSKVTEMRETNELGVGHAMDQFDEYEKVVRKEKLKH